VLGLVLRVRVRVSVVVRVSVPFHIDEIDLGQRLGLALGL